MEIGFKDRMEARGIFYSFFSRAYREEIDAAFIEELRAACSPEDDLLAPFAQALHSDDVEALRRDLAGDYARCLLGMHADPVSPFESVWVSGLHLMMQEPRDEVVALYRSEGVDKAQTFHMPEDHIAVELEFAALLCRRAIEAFDENDPVALEENIAKQKAFVHGHLAAWVPDFCRKLRVRSTTEFYRALADATEAFIAADAEEVDRL
ncbi:MAG: molecular chaperone TorD family protein [Slackia sp.]|nr:molecular chaperone TorD family protein [Slackia sp.]